MALIYMRCQYLLLVLVLDDVILGSLGPLPLVLYLWQSHIKPAGGG